jgi:hypothetical protein
MPDHQPRQRRFALGGRLQKCARRQRHVRLADFQQWLGALRHQFAVARQARELMGRGEARQFGDAFRRQRAGAAHIHVDAGIGRGHVNIERLFRGLEYFGHRPGRGNGAVEAGRQDRATVDRDDVVGAGRREADFQHIMGAAPCM